MAEALNQRLESERNIDSILGLRISWGFKWIHHSQFVDDTLLLGGALKIIVVRCKDILDQFT
jgi:hypothetical protein